MTEQLWYPLWDAGFVTGHGARTIKESIALANDDLDALTALLDIRVIAGQRDLAVELERKARDLAGAPAAAGCCPVLADAADLRRQRPGRDRGDARTRSQGGRGRTARRAVARMGRLGVGCARAAARRCSRATSSTADDLARVEAGRELLLDIRVALQRITGSRSDRLALQEQDAVAARLDFADGRRARARSRPAAREIAWIAGDVWSRVRDMLDGSEAKGAQRRPSRIAEGVWLRDGRVHIDADPDGSIPPLADARGRVRRGRARRPRSIARR